MRTIEYINDNWKFRRAGSTNIETVEIPHANIELPYNNFDESLFAFNSIYEKELIVKSNGVDEKVFVCFEGVASYAKVFIDGIYIGEHKGGYTGFEFDITENIRGKEKILLKVEVDSTERNDIPPFGNVIDYLTYGGIYREVYIKRVHKSFIKDLFIKTSNIYSKSKAIEINLELSQVIENTRAEIFVVDKKSKEIMASTKVDINSENSIINMTVINAELWSIDNPKLYEIKIDIAINDEVIDTVVEGFGFREAIFKNDGFYLNNKKIKLLGLNRHQSFAHVGYAMPESMQIKDAQILKYELGVNIVRTSHYPQHKAFLDKCDEIGLLVFTEIPGWQHIGQGDDWRGVVLQNVEEMIVRDRNHPSIILWGVRINESPDCNELYEKTNKLARELDPTRQTGGVRNFAGSNFLEDVYTYNDFSHTGNNKALQKAISVKKVKEAPYLVSEHNGHMFPTKSFDNEGKRLEHALRHMRVMDEMYGSEDISGSIGWCMFDYNTHSDFGSGDKICYHGVMDMYRIPKLAAYVYSSQQESNPVMEVASSMDIGEHPGGFMGEVHVFTNCDFIKFYKNDKYIGEFYPDRINFKNVPHPPIIINDFIGDALETEEGYDKKQAEKIKGLLMAIAKYGMDMPLKYKVKVPFIMIKNKLSFNQGTELFSKYVGDWGGKRTVYKFEGYTNGQLVKTVIKGSVTKAKIKAEIDNKELIIGNTYDATRIVVKAVSEDDNLLPFANDVIEVKTEGPIKIIGEAHLALIGGVRGIYIKTAGEVGKAKVVVGNKKLGYEEININIKKL